jgi:hypothetical protein
MIKSEYRSACKVPLFLSDVNETWIFSIVFENIQILNFMKIRPVEAELFHADELEDRRTDMTNLIVAIRNLANTPKNIYTLSFSILSDDRFKASSKTIPPHSGI